MLWCLERPLLGVLGRSGQDTAQLHGARDGELRGTLGWAVKVSVSDPEGLAGPDWGWGGWAATRLCLPQIQEPG